MENSTKITLSITVILAAMIMIGVLYFNGYISFDKDYGNEVLNELYKGSFGRVRTMTEFNVLNITVNNTKGYPEQVQVELTAFAYYNTTVKVISKHSFINGTEFPYDDISPYDLFFRWGEFAKPEYDNSLNTISYKNEVRAAFINFKSYDEVDLYNKYKGYESNNHAIILDEKVRKTVDVIKDLDIVHFEGYLVKVKVMSNGRTYGTWGEGGSDITDTGKSLISPVSCEVFYITNATILTL